MTWKDFKTWMESSDVGVQDDDTIAYIDIMGCAFPDFTAECESDPSRGADWRIV